MKQLRPQVIARIEELRDIVGREHAIDVPMPNVRYILRGTVAGRVNYATGNMDLNPVLAVDNRQPYVHNTVGHEFAHLAVDFIHGTVPFPHGGEWQDMMRLFGLKPMITHNYDVSMVDPVYTWHCGCQVHQVSRRVHRQLVAGAAEFECVTCGKDVNKYVSQMGELDLL